MAELDSRYQQTNEVLQGFVDEALLELSNTRSAASALIEAFDEIDVPDAPDTSVELGEPPKEPTGLKEAPPINVPDMPSVSASADFPHAPAAPGAPQPWGSPRTPKRGVDYRQFFTGTPDTPQEVIDRANEAVEAWVGAYFPAIKDCFVNVPDEWVCDVISGVRPLGNSERAIDIAWRRAKANEFAQLSSERQTIASEFVSRGFALPPGAMVAQLRRSQERFSDATAAVNREAALKDVDVQVQLLQTAAEVASQLKLGLAQAMVSFYNTIAGIDDKAGQLGNERAQIVASAENQFVSALNTYEQINQAYYESLNSLRLEAGRAGIELYGQEVRAAAAKGTFSVEAAQLNLRAAEAKLEAAVERSRAVNETARTSAEIYSTRSRQWAAKVQAEVSVAQFEVEKYRAEVQAAIAKSGAESNQGAGAALSGVAQGFGSIGQAAANASGTLIAQIEGF